MRIGVAILIALLLGSTQAMAGDVADCRAIDNDAERLACYDALASTPEPKEPPPAPAPPAPETKEAPAPAPAAAPPPAPEDLGAEALPDQAREEKTPETFSATVTSCGESVDGRYLFYFDNGQIWKQANDKRLYFRDCKFDVTITKDFFGYKMQQVGEKKRIRIKRMR